MSRVKRIGQTIKSLSYTERYFLDTQNTCVEEEEGVSLNVTCQA